MNCSMSSPAFGYNLYYLENFEETGNKILLEKKNMTDRKHFEMLAIHKDNLQRVN